MLISYLTTLLAKGRLATTGAKDASTLPRRSSDWLLNAKGIIRTLLDGSHT